ncbi:uncharacterized protein LOC123447245 isoform X2 [Hordeum vulgare subsp. vulgare]|uniref:uncharacterized protein LOC123447245 isoform X2 n=1 Tax=Hordeum vulgare subsp. vulgare TaxID=112509 RepID=UPI001D1A3B1C|nr:uncharacterized protein LOC123447245 isoform X2 [Hordeum vulgare subsp. vulgare]
MMCRCRRRRSSSSRGRKRDRTSSSNRGRERGKTSSSKERRRRSSRRRGRWRMWKWTMRERWSPEMSMPAATVTLKKGKARAKASTPTRRSFRSLVDDYLRSPDSRFLELLLVMVGQPDGVEERKRELTDKLDTLSKKKHDLVQMLKQILNAEEEIRTRSMQASLRAAMPQPPENTADGSVPRQVPRMTVDVNFSEFAGESDAGSNQGTPGRPLHHVHSISPSTASFARSPFGSRNHNPGNTPRSPAAPFSTVSPSRFAGTGHQGHHPSASLPASNFVASSPSPAASGGSSSVFRDYRPPSST